MVNGITFSEQLTTSADFAHFQNTFLNRADGITKGCGISHSDGNVYVQKGYFVVCGRFVRVVGVETIPTPEVLSGQLYCKVVFEVDLTKVNTPEEFGQGYFRVLQNASGYPELTQEDLDADGTLYQMPWCQFVKAVDGISEFRDLRSIMNLDSIWEAVATQNGTYKGEFDAYFAAQKTVIERMIKELEGQGYLTLEDAGKAPTVTLTADGWTENASGLYEQTAAVEGITAEDMAVLLKYSDPEILETDSINYGADFAKISGGRAAAGSITFYAMSRLDSDITVALALGKKGDGRLLMGGGGSGEKAEHSNVIITILDGAAVAEGWTVTATCNNKSWKSTIRNGKARLYTSEVGNYIITATDTDEAKYTTILVCPYFGQFSTDIYSGSLMVYGTEAGCSGKTCTVRSCDNDYNPTNNYDLTQTFDSTLELPFPGIPAGKYLITVDGKYVFFKKITSIQNINSVNVCLRQYLYNNGDQCVHNTGGWMQCLYSGVAYIGAIKDNSSVGVLNRNITFADKTIDISGSIYSSVVSAVMYNKIYYCRGGGRVDAFIGTHKPLPISAQKYTCMKLITSQNVWSSLREGAENNVMTDVSTPTVLTSGGGNVIPLAMGNYNPYIVIGNTLFQGYHGNDTLSTGIQGSASVLENPGNLNISFNASISEIWLE